MDHINQLRGFGKGRKCLLVGGGHSLKGFSLDSVPPDVYIICANNHKYLSADMVVYMDADMNQYWEECGEELYDDTLLIGYSHKAIANVCERCTHYYTHEDMVFGDTGFHMLQFADKIFNFKEIYLIGYDYSTFENSYHWNEDKSDKIKMGNFIKHSESVLPRYSEIKWKNKIYNLSLGSKLECFDKVSSIL